MVSCRREARRREAHLATIADINDEIHPRELWLLVPGVGGATERSIELPMAGIELATGFEVAADYHLGRTFGRVGTEV